MDLSGILSIAGYPGLFKMVSQMKTGLVVESLLDGKRMPAYSTQKILALEDISIYTEDDDVPLHDLPIPHQASVNLPLVFLCSSFTKLFCLLAFERAAGYTTRHPPPPRILGSHTQHTPLPSSSVPSQRTARWQITFVGWAGVGAAGPSALGAGGGGAA